MGVDAAGGNFHFRLAVRDLRAPVRIGRLQQGEKGPRRLRGPFSVIDPAEMAQAASVFSTSLIQ
jgi:hypothetical protein